MNLAVELSGFFILGISGGFGHCTLMCNPIVVLVSSRFCADKPGYQLLIPHLFYNAGRIVTYMILGAIAGILGSVLQYAGDTFMNVQRLSSIVGGSFMVLYALSTLFHIHTKLITKFNFHKLVNGLQLSSPFLFGLAFGLLPCGLSMGAVIGTVATGNAMQSALLMMAFGIGTMAAMMTMAVFSSVALKYIKILNKFAMVFLIIMGIYFIYMGFNY